MTRRTDGQLHIWEADRPERPWDGRFSPQLPEPFTTADALALLDQHGVERAVLVPPLLSGFNSDTANHYALEAATAFPDRFRVMGRFDPRPADAPGVLEGWLAQPGMAGLRFSLEGPPAPQIFEEGALEWLWPAAERLGIPLFVYRPQRPQDLAAIAERHPDLRLCCDHLALGGERSPDGLAAHLEALKVLLPHQNVILKVSSLPLCSLLAYPYPDLHDSIRRLRDLFGASRLAWATDYTAIRGRLGDRITYEQARDLFETALRDLSPTERADLYDGTISRFLRWD